MRSGQVIADTIMVATERIGGLLLAKIHESIDIQANQESVWEFLSNLENISGWYSKMVGYRQLSEGETGVGTYFRLDWIVNDHAEPCECNILEWQPPSVIRFHVSNIGMVEADITWNIIGGDESTRVEVIESIEMAHSGRFEDRFFIGPEAESRLRDNLVTLKGLLES